MQRRLDTVESMREERSAQPTVCRDGHGNPGPGRRAGSPALRGLGTFARLPQRHEVGDYDIAVVGVPFDSGVTYRPGARFGPAAIRQASRLLKPYNPALDVTPFATAQVVDAGDIAANPFDIDAAVDEIRAGVLGLIARPEQRVVLLGGDHTIALPALQAINQVHGPVALVHFDAHLDTWDTYFGAPCTHGTPFRRAVRAGAAGQGPLRARRHPRLAL